MTTPAKCRYIRPELDGHKVLYKGLRYWVFEVSAECPWEGLEGYWTIAVFDGEFGVTVAYCNEVVDAGFEGYIEWGQSGLPVSGKDIKELVRDVIRREKWIKRELENAR